MAKAISSEQVIQINERYAECHNYSQVARELGVSPSTVRKYVRPDYKIVAEVEIQHPDLPLLRLWAQNYSLSKTDMANPDILKLTEQEEEDLKVLWKELKI